MSKSAQKINFTHLLKSFLKNIIQSGMWTVAQLNYKILV